MKQQPLVSVIIPTYSRPNNLVRAIESVLAQTYKNIEIIVVDDNGVGTPYQVETERVLSDYITQGKIIYLKHEVNKNGSAARNTGVKKSKGSYVTFLDDDDEYHYRKIEKQVGILENNSDYSATYCGFQIIKGSKVLKKVHPIQEGNLQYELLACRWSFGTGSNPMFRRSVFDDIGLFDDSFIRHQDLEIMVRFFRKHRIKVLPEILINRYIDSRINSLDLTKFLNVKYKYLNTFEQDIRKFDIRRQNIIFRNQFADVACHAMKDKQYKAAITLYKKANSYKMLSLRIIAKAFAYGFLNFQAE